MRAGRFTARSATRRPFGGDLHQELTRRLRDLPPGPAPDVQFKSDLRAQLVAITARVVTESAEANSPQPTGLSRLRRPLARGTAVPAGQSSPAGRLSGHLRLPRRPVLALVCSSATLAVLIGVVVWGSGDAMPGDALYSIKRANESVQLSLSRGDSAKGASYLHLARTRADEAVKLLGRPTAIAGSGFVAGSEISAHVSELVSQTLGDADDSVRSGTQLLAGAAVADVEGGPLITLSDWLPEQRARLTTILARVPSGLVHDRSEASISLLDRVQSRASQLLSKLGCNCLAQGISDDLGPLPCPVCTAAPPSGHGVPAPGKSAPGVLPALPGKSTPGRSPLPGLSTGGFPALPRVPVPALPGVPDPGGVVTGSGGSSLSGLPASPQLPRLSSSVKVPVLPGVSISIGLPILPAISTPIVKPSTPVAIPSLTTHSSPTLPPVSIPRPPATSPAPTVSSPAGVPTAITPHATPSIPTAVPSPTVPRRPRSSQVPIPTSIPSISLP